jgi:hypothetical protein
MKAIVDRFASLAAVVRDADPADKAEIYRGLNLVLAYQPGTHTVRAEAQLSRDSPGAKVGVRGGIDPIPPHCSISYGADIDLQHPGGPRAP